MITLKAIFLNYLLVPLVAVLLAALMAYVKKKNKILKNKTLILYLLLASLVLALPGIGGLAGNTFSPYWYLFAQLLYLCLGIYHIRLMAHYFKRTGTDKKSNVYAILFELLLTIMCLLLGSYLFTLLFNWLSPYKGYGLTASTSLCIFIMPLIFNYTYTRFLAIPFAIYKVWQYTPGVTAGFENRDLGTLMLVNLELTKTPVDGHRFAIKAKSPQNLPLGEWMNRVIEDFNLKNPTEPIQTTSDTGEEHGWIFYVKPSFFHMRRYLDYEKSVADNKLSEKNIVICKRVIRHEEEKVISVV
ncbi:hypothetical protein SAMN05421788_105185 [Filimonas lacunae]|uniref:Uncharacterized protein n=1 Tax=Filimonas lacunae TaxID=477680 RepID=A0A173MCW5_9BACT|nr:TssN family type VI secretion system protein [Filimonas lacunae]BAV05360.1 hypothetical protein FLA_1367 [Filimonas lacunae]SIT21751.1 hypothetical protein SAMN05421788_105185 [Filimonas lacunae]